MAIGPINKPVSGAFTSLVHADQGQPQNRVLVELAEADGRVSTSGDASRLQELLNGNQSNQSAPKFSWNLDKFLKRV